MRWSPMRWPPGWSTPAPTSPSAAAAERVAAATLAVIGTGKRIGKTAVPATSPACCTVAGSTWSSWRWAAAARPSRS